MTKSICYLYIIWIQIPAHMRNMTNTILKEKRIRKMTLMFLRALSCVMERYVHAKYYGDTYVLYIRKPCIRRMFQSLSQSRPRLI